MLLLINCGLLQGSGAGITAYFAPYMVNRFNSNNLNALLPLGLSCLLHILGVSVAEIIGERVQHIKDEMRSIGNIIVNQDEDENGNQSPNINQRQRKEKLNTH